MVLRHALRITDSKIMQRSLHTNAMDKLRPLWQKRWLMLSTASYTNEGLQDESGTIEVAKRQQAVRSDNYQLVIVGTGWAGYQMFTECSKHLADIEKNVGGKNVDIVVVSMRNHFLYTPLLASTTVGTLEFQSITEPIRDGMLRHEGDFHLASVKEIDPEKKDLFVKSALGSRREYPIKYDTLEIHHAQKIRNRILENFEVATQPGVTPEEKARLLHFVVVGGGPTGIEFCAELYDLVLQDLRHMYPEVSKYLGVTLLDSGEILSGFDKQLRESRSSMRNPHQIESRSSMRNPHQIESRSSMRNPRHR
ncbi:Pyridine nucleotide-disulfide oxidoreductase [Phytophthora infestans]|uniref:Pyridine nucleotide-disulfide oxidoreductase n=1 Tax=Phytophthora infestans TaxID=4787 RepID=A0A833WMP2_PHYIN|nr:Pyridine nucleotide-disulfide oxidoreductase [Phytophthora infestans]KAF4128570.1 Pyridine nucleotide-disulfide oxidoreductase [Phytophthora infestans]